MAHTQARQQVTELFAGLKDKEQLMQVGMALEKLSAEEFSSLPKIGEFRLSEGRIKEITFTVILGRSQKRRLGQ